MYGDRSVDAGVELSERRQHIFAHFRVTSDSFCGISVDPTWAERQCFDALRGQLGGVFGGDHLHRSLGGGVSHDGREASHASEVDGSTLARDEDDLLLLAVANEFEESVDDEHVVDHNASDLYVVSPGYLPVALRDGSYVLIDLTLQICLFATTTYCQRFNRLKTVIPGHLQGRRWKSASLGARRCSIENQNIE